MKRLSTLTLIMVFGLSTLCFDANGRELQRYIENPKQVGQARLSVLFWDVYDATLIAPDGKYTAQGPYALELKYLRDFDGDDIASRSIDEMRKQGVSDEIKLAKWYEQMHQIFPNVKKGQTITGIVDANHHSHFYFNDEFAGTVEDTEFTDCFFNIWLSENTSEPKMRSNLLGLRK